MHTPVFFEGIIDEDPSTSIGLEADAPQIGRVLVRELLGHSDRVDSTDLIPATVLMPTTSAAIAGIGSSPTGLLKGTRVMCMKMAGMTYVLGTINIAPEGNHSVSSYARGQGEPPLKSQLRVTAEDGTVEPDSKYDAKWPYNNTMTTRSGHLLEFDDTPSAERIHVYHKSGSYIEILPDGSIVTKSVKDSISVTMNDQAITVVNGDMQIVANDGKIQINSYGDIDLVSKNGVVNCRGVKIGLNG